MSVVLFVVTVVFYSIMVALLNSMLKDYLALRKDLREYFKQIDYHNIQLLLKNRENQSQRPPDSGEDDA